jgi:hypothetical protein
VFSFIKPFLLFFPVLFRTVWAAGKVLARHHSHLSPALHHTIPTLAGLAMIPLVVPHIDHAVTEWMDTKVRPHLNLPETVPVKKINVAGHKIQQGAFSR